MTRRWPVVPTVAVLLGGVAVAGCGDSASGPGPLSATVVGPGPLGAAVVEVSGRGITGFEGAGSVRTFAAATGAEVYHVVLVATEGGDLPFRILVEDRKESLPAAVVLSAVDPQNVPMATLVGYSVRVFR
jgi:hypothetical protein